jgi:hypothetical protein
LRRVVGLKLVWAVTVFGALSVLCRGLLAGSYFEPTSEALVEARWGAILVSIACGLLLAAAGYAVMVAAWPRWVAGGLLMPMVLCGGLTSLAPETLFPQLPAVVAFPIAMASGVAGLVRRGGP